MRYPTQVSSMTLLLTALATVPAAGQGLAPLVLPAGLEQREPAPPAPLAERVVGSTVLAAAGGVLGWFAVGYAAYYLAGGSRVCGDDACGFVGRLIGGALGEAVGIGLGAHLGNGRRGDPLASVGASIAVLFGAVALSERVHAGDAWLVVVPALQISTAVLAELITCRRTEPSP